MNNRHNQLSGLVQRLNLGSAALPHMIAMTDEVRFPDPTEVIPRLSRNSVLILRHYGVPTRALLAAKLVPLCRHYGVRLLIANDARLAYAVHADGLHLSEHALRRGAQAWRQWCPAHWLVTAAAHSPVALRRAARAGAHAALLAPVFPTASHPGRTSLGILRLMQWSRNSPVPVYALGGIDISTVRRLAGCPLAGIAGIGGFIKDRD